MTDAAIPATHRWIPKGMTVEYLGKAGTDLKAMAVIDPIPEFGKAMNMPVRVSTVDEAGQIVFRAAITMWVSPKKADSAEK